MCVCVRARARVCVQAFLDLKSGVGVVMLTNGDWCQGAPFESALVNIEHHLRGVFARIDGDVGDGGAGRRGMAGNVTAHTRDSLRHSAPVARHMRRRRCD